MLRRQFLCLAAFIFIFNLALAQETGNVDLQMIQKIKQESFQNSKDYYADVADFTEEICNENLKHSGTVRPVRLLWLSKALAPGRNSDQYQSSVPVRHLRHQLCQINQAIRLGIKT